MIDQIGADLSLSPSGSSPSTNPMQGFGGRDSPATRVASRTSHPARAMLGAGAFLAPGASPLARPSDAGRGGARRAAAMRVVAKGQRGVRRVRQANFAEEFAPGSVLGKMMNLRLNKINWEVMSDAADKLDGELSSQAILGLVRAEVAMRGIDALKEENRGYKEYILLRSLGLKAWFTMATSRAGIHDPRTRCAVGKALSSPDGEYNIYRRIFAHAPLAAAGDWDGFADGLASDAKAVAEALTASDLNTTKVRYDASVTETHFAWMGDEVKRVEEAMRRAKVGDAPVVVAARAPWVDPGASPVGAAGGADSSAGGADSSAGGADAAAAADAEEDSVESMFGKKKKKKKKKGGLGAAVSAVSAVSAAASAAGSTGAPASLDQILGGLVKKQQEPTFPELEAWCVGSSQATASEAAACAASIALAAPENATVVAPSSLVASCLAFDTKSLGRNRRVVSVTEAASDALTFEDGEDGVCVCIVFDPPAVGGFGGEDAALARTVAKAKAAGAPCVLAAVTLVGGGACERGGGTAGADAAGEAAEARVMTRAGL